MRLRNKKTGEIVEVESCNSTTGTIGLFFAEGRECDRAYNSLAELNEEWEDYEDPEVYWFINSCGEVLRNIDASDYVEGTDNLSHKEIGNYFGTQEEAEKAVEKLKAWKRLKDKGFRFEDWFGVSKVISFQINEWIDGDITKDLDLLFGGEE